MKKILLYAFVLGILWSCSSPLDRPYNLETVQEDMKAVSSKLDTNEIFVLGATIIRMQFSGDKIDNMTYRDILEKGKKWKAEQDKIEAEQKAAREKAIWEEAERIKRLSESVMVTCVSKSYTEYDYQEYITYKFVIENKTDRAIRAVKGSISFTNLFDDEINSLNFVYDELIEAKGKVTWNAQTEYNQFMDKDVTLKNKDLDDLKVIWEPLKVIFADGSTLE